MKKLILFALLIALVGCTTAPFQPPEICQNGAKSLILEKIPNPAALSSALLVVQIAALEGAKQYTGTDALKALDQIDTLLASTTSYAGILSLINSKIKTANNLAGAAVFLIGDKINLLDSPALLSPCDRELIRMHLAKQRAVLALYVGGNQ